MSQPFLYFHIAQAAGGLVVSVFMTRLLFRIVRERKIPRRQGKKPITPDEDGYAYWGFTGWLALGTVGIICGTGLVIFNLLRLQLK